MSRARGLRQHLAVFQELADVMTAMKNLALTETRKLTRYQVAQREVVATIERAAADFLSHHPGLLPTIESETDLTLLIGSERGFCGEFNERLRLAAEEHLRGVAAPSPQLVVVGRRLCQKMAGDPRVVAEIEGPSVIEEVDDALRRVLERLNALTRGAGAFSPLALTVIHHAHETEGRPAEVRVVRPLAHFTPRPPAHPTPPLLLLPPDRFLTGLIDQYLLAALHEIFYTSLMAENHHRLVQLEGAIRKMEQRVDDWSHRLNTLRQEEITEEIEEIMLSVDALSEPPMGMA